MNARTEFPAAKPRRLTVNYKREMRKQAEAALHQLIDILDALDGDPDFEPELSAGLVSGSRVAWSGKDCDWLVAPEYDDNADFEPSLGAPNPTFVEVAGIWKGDRYLRDYDPLDQSGWTSGGDQDLEAQCEDEGWDDSDTGADDHGELSTVVAYVEDQANGKWSYGD